jgi:hypothetical protein
MFKWFYDNVVSTTPSKVVAFLLLGVILVTGAIGVYNLEVYNSFDLFVPLDNPVATDLKIAEQFFSDNGITINF